MRECVFYFLSFLAGVIIGDIWIDSGLWILVIFSLIFVVWNSGKWVRIGLVILVCYGGFFLSLWTVHSFEFSRDVLGEKVGWGAFTDEVTGTLGEMVSSGESSRKYRLKELKINNEKLIMEEGVGGITGITEITGITGITGVTGTTGITGDALLIVPSNLSLKSGDHITAMGKFSFPPDTPEYAAEKNLWNRGMMAEFRTFQITSIPPEKYSIFVRLQSWFDARLTLLFPREGHDLLSGILLGQRTDMDATLRGELKNSGLMHLMVVSGGNVMMLIIFLSLFIRSVPVYLRIGIISFTIVAFVLLVGGDTAVWRAALMGVVGYGAMLWGYRFPRMLLPLIVATLLALWNPLSLVYDIGLQLSFLSVICIIAWGKTFARWFHILGSFFAEATALTVAATLGTLPITVFYFGTFSLVGPLANLFAAPAIPILMYSGIVTLFVSTFSPTLAYWAGYIPWIASSYLYRVIHLFGSPSWSMIQIDLGQYRESFILVTLSILFLCIVRTVRRP